jgi:hypothetical protein
MLILSSLEALRAAGVLAAPCAFLAGVSASNWRPIRLCRLHFFFARLKLLGDK